MFMPLGYMEKVEVRLPNTSYKNEDGQRLPTNESAIFKKTNLPRGYKGDKSSRHVFSISSLLPNGLWICLVCLLITEKDLLYASICTLSLPSESSFFDNMLFITQTKPLLHKLPLQSSQTGAPLKLELAKVIPKKWIAFLLLFFPRRRHPETTPLNVDGKLCKVEVYAIIFQKGAGPSSPLVC